MNEQRLKRLLEFLHEDPTDPFNRYAVAQEYLREQPLEAQKHFEVLINEHPNYVGTYYHLAQLYADLGETEKAQITYEKGIAVAQAAQELKTVKELQAAYTNFMFEND